MSDERDRFLREGEGTVKDEADFLLPYLRDAFLEARKKGYDPSTYRLEDFLQEESLHMPRRPTVTEEVLDEGWKRYEAKAVPVKDRLADIEAAIKARDAAN